MGRVILIGYMGAGKTTLGKALAQKSEAAFIDTDSRIEVREKKTVAEIFKESKEAGFRLMETELLKELLLERQESFVMATGGGMPLKQENQLLLKRLGTIIFLKASKDSILERIGNDMGRPLLWEEDREAKIKHMLEEREPIYQQLADYTIVTDGKKTEELLEEMQVCLRDALRERPLE